MAEYLNIPPLDLDVEPDGHDWIKFAAKAVDGKNPDLPRPDSEEYKAMLATRDTEELPPGWPTATP